MRNGDFSNLGGEEIGEKYKKEETNTKISSAKIRWRWTRKREGVWEDIGRETRENNKNEMRGCKMNETGKRERE